MKLCDKSEELQTSVIKAFESKSPLNIQGGGSKQFYGRSVKGKLLCTKQHQGVVSYEPTELVIKAYAGTPLKQIEQILSENNQILPFEPPSFGDDATLGGTIACNLSGPLRAYSGAARDFVLGTRIINGKGEMLSFGGEVMKNVAGYDASRLMAGAMGTLGLMLDISIKVVPKSESEITLVHELDANVAITKMHQWARQPLPVTATCYHNSKLYVRLSGTEKSLVVAKQKIGGELLENSQSFWYTIREQQHEFFSDNRSLWRISLASNSPELNIQGDSLYEWNGALRWLLTEEPAEVVRAALKEGDNATLFRSNKIQDDVFQPLPKQLLKLHRSLKQAFDPNAIFNCGRMYKDL